MSKYPRTYHFSFSPEVHSDDKVMSKEIELSFIGEEIIITEKLDGGNASLRNGKVFARTHSVEATHPSFSMLKRVNQFLVSSGRLDSSEEIFGENMEGIHSIEYSKLESPFYIFNIRKNETWFSWEDIVLRSKELRLPTVPILFKGKVHSLKELEELSLQLLSEESILGGEREGVVIRKAQSFINLSENIGKVVRKGHVQTDEHWSKNWKKAEISKRFWINLYT